MGSTQNLGNNTKGIEPAAGSRADTTTLLPRRLAFATISMRFSGVGRKESTLLQVAASGGPWNWVTRYLDKGTCSILGGSWDLVSRVISTLIGIISNSHYSYLTYNPSY